jgi:myo-inositol-1(or 4)-monophosphatase
MHPMLNTATKAARRAGALINRASMDIDTVRVGTKGPGDFVTEVDQAVESDIINTLLDAYPQHGIVSEEIGQAGNAGSPYQWIIDPLDGTTNFIHGIPHYAVSMAMKYEGETQIALIYQPATNDLYTAEKGRGAALNNRRLRVTRRMRLAEALIGTSFRNRRNASWDALMSALSELSLTTAGVRRMGSASLDLAQVAAGRLDACYGVGLGSWDMAAGALLVSEAGGLVSDLHGGDDYLARGHIVAGSPKIFPQLMSKLDGVAMSLKLRVAEGDPAATESATAADASNDAAAAAEAKPKVPPRRLARKATAAKPAAK